MLTICVVDIFVKLAIPEQIDFTLPAQFRLIRTDF